MSHLLDSVIEAFDLNAHPFYQDWRAGTLPAEKLAEYAAEYRAFVETIADGWETLGFTAYAAEERVHDGLWAEFQDELGATGPARNPETDVLVTAANRLFNGSKSQAAGALYAFEAQQPKTSRVKLDGLREHYPNVVKGQVYFEVHADDVAEAEALRDVFAAMSEAELAQARAACAVVASAMWTALDGVYYA